ncbi:MAG: hypothetical protein IT286_05310, partial [Proteobacteria bacterium]|nr:hypothetical protein [Pseudomonadota bacterium]
MDYKDHEINMITSPIKEVAVWLPRYEDPSNIHGVSNVVGSRDENVRFQLANYLVQDVWSQMDREKFNRAYGADLKQVEADLNDREKNKYLNTSGIKEGLWAMFKSKHQEETADQNARFNEAKLDLIVQLTGELEHESYPMQSTPTESLCYEVQYYYESFYLNDDMSMSFPSSITASGNPFLSHGATSHIPCSKIDVLRSRILNVMN